MRELRPPGIDDYPRHGARARAWERFERGLEAWLATPEGRFAVWAARRSLAAPLAPREQRTI